MKMVTEYLAQAAEFERMASAENNPTFKEQLLEQAAAYRKLAKERAEKLKIPLPPCSNQRPEVGTTRRTRELYCPVS